MGENDSVRLKWSVIFKKLGLSIVHLSIVNPEAEL